MIIVYDNMTYSYQGVNDDVDWQEDDQQHSAIVESECLVLAEGNIDQVSSLQHAKQGEDDHGNEYQVNRNITIK